MVRRSLPVRQDIDVVYQFGRKQDSGSSPSPSPEPELSTSSSEPVRNF